MIFVSWNLLERPLGSLLGPRGSILTVVVHTWVVSSSLEPSWNHLGQVWQPISTVLRRPAALRTVWEPPGNTGPPPWGVRPENTLNFR